MKNRVGGEEGKRRVNRGQKNVIWCSYKHNYSFYNISVHVSEVINSEGARYEGRKEGRVDR